jgi:hypothetical protein
MATAAAAVTLGAHLIASTAAAGSPTDANPTPAPVESRTPRTHRVVRLSVLAQTTHLFPSGLIGDTARCWLTSVASPRWWWARWTGEMRTSRCARAGPALSGDCAGRPDLRGAPAERQLGRAHPAAGGNPGGVVLLAFGLIGLPGRAVEAVHGDRPRARGLSPSQTQPMGTSEQTACASTLTRPASVCGKIRRPAVDAAVADGLLRGRLSP